MTLTIEFPDGHAAALKAKAAWQGLTLEAWFKKLAEIESPDPHPPRTVANIVLDSMRRVPPEAFTGRPKDGASEHDHYLYGHRKRNS